MDWSARAYSLIHQACVQIELDKKLNEDRIMAWHLRFLDIGNRLLDEWKQDSGPSTAEGTPDE